MVQSPYLILKVWLLQPKCKPPQTPCATGVFVADSSAETSFAHQNQAVSIRPIGRKVFKKRIDRFAVPGENLPIPPITPIPAKCKHPQVRVVARDEDTEFVECQRCGEVFDAGEYRDMMLEEEELSRTPETAAGSA